MNENQNLKRSIAGCHPDDSRLDAAQSGWARAANGQPLYGPYYNSLRNDSMQQCYELFWLSARELFAATGRKPSPWPRGTVMPLDVFAWHTVQYDLAKNPKWVREFQTRRAKAAQIYAQHQEEYRREALIA